MGLPNSNPGVLTPSGLIQSPKQVWDYVLCYECEQMLNDKGEKYVMSHIYGRGSFPLLGILSHSKLEKADRFLTWFDKRSTPTINRDALGYFALSVFWRAAVRKWKMFGGLTLQLDLGSYKESIRSYLVGQAPFPADTILMAIVCTDSASQNTFFAPNKSGEAEGRPTHMFQARGLIFMMTTGTGMVDAMKSLCMASGSDRWIGMRGCEDKARIAVHHIAGEAGIREVFGR